jgi:hypothetical protein
MNEGCLDGICTTYKLLNNEQEDEECDLVYCRGTAPQTMILVLQPVT